MSSSNIAPLTLGNIEIWQSSQNVMTPMSARGFETIMDKNQSFDFYSLPAKSPKNKNLRKEKKKNKELQNSLKKNTKLTKASFVLCDDDDDDEWSRDFHVSSVFSKNSRNANKTYYGCPDRLSLEYKMSTTALNEYNALDR